MNYLATILLLVLVLLCLQATSAAPQEESETIYIYNADAIVAVTTNYFMALFQYDNTVLNGADDSFTTRGESRPPTVTTENATNITTASATLNMAYDFMKYRFVHVQFKYKAEGASAWDETGWVSKTRSSSHSFSESIAGLSSGTTYYSVAQLKYDGTVLNGTEISFTTSGEPRTPAVTTKKATNITTASATLNMAYDFMDYRSVHVQFRYKAEGASAWNETGWVSQSGSGSHSFSEPIAGLSSNTTYFMALLLYDGTVLNGTENSFTTSGEPRPPTFSTKNATNITTASATLNMTYDFMDYSTVQVQFMYKAEGASGWNETGWVAQSGSGTHSFSESIAGLSSNTTHYFMALILYDCTVLNGTESSFKTSGESRPPTVTTKNVTNITTASATLNMTYDFRDYSSVQVQFRYKAEGASAWDETGWVSKTRSSTHSFSESIAGLSSGTTYYFMAQLKYDGAVLNGTENSFTTSSESRPPTVSTKNATNITTASATLNMTYDFMDYSSVQVQFKYKAEGASAWDETGWVAQTGSGSHSFSEPIASLSSNTPYYFSAQLKYEGTVLNGTEMSFTTSSEPRAPAVSTENATNITTASTTLNMAYDFMDYSLVHVQFRYKAEGASAWDETGWVAQSGSGTHSFSESIAGLSSNTTYFMALLLYDGTVLNGTENSFTTSIEPRLPTVTTKNATNIIAASATLNMTYDFMDYRSVQVQFRYKAEGASAWNETGWVAQTGSGSHSFSEPIAGLSSNTTYHFSALLQYDGISLNGTEVSFTTSGELRAPAKTILIYNADAVVDITASTPPDDTLNSSDALPQDGVQTILIYNADAFIDHTASTPPDDTLNSSDALPQDGVKTILIYNADAFIDLTASTPPDDALDSSDALPQEEVKTILIYNADAVINLTASTPPEDALDSSDALPQGGVKTILIYDADAVIDLTASTPPIPQPPIANAGQDQSGFSGSLVILDGSNSYDPDPGGTIVRYEWDFGDGETAEGRIVTHRFRGAADQPRTYAVTLTVEDDTGDTDTDTTYITVMPLEKTVEVTHLVLVPLDTVFARMRVSYNWIYDNSYVVSKIHYESEGGGFLGVATISIWDTHSHLIPTPLWATNIFSHGSKKEKTYYPKLVTILYGGDTFEGIKVDGFDAMNIIIEGWAGLSIPMGLPFPPVPFYETNSICFQPDYTEVPDLPIEAPDLELAYLCSPGELLVYDAQGRVTGLINGDVKNEIPNSSYCNNSIILLPSSESYRYNIAGTEEGTYGLMVASIIEEVNNSFTATDISTSTNATHQYTIDWEALSQGEEGVTIQIDNDGDGTFEQNITTDDTFEPPNVAFTYSPAHPVVNETIVFNASESKDHDGYITNYKWEFGNGNITDTTEPIINQTYASIGEYAVNLTVTDDDGATSATAKMITVSSMPDLVITEKWLCWPDNCTICYNVTNIGNGTAPACHNTTLYVDGVAVAHDHVPVDLAPGETYTGCFNGYVWTYTPPSDNITVCADNNETLAEFDEDNNCLTNIWMCGDVTGDGRVRTSDGRRIFRHLTFGDPIDNLWAADVTGDGRVRTSDGRRIFRHLTFGDPLNCNCSG